MRNSSTQANLAMLVFRTRARILPQAPCAAYTDKQDGSGGNEMIYPIYVHKDSGSAFSAEISDFSGCFSAADDLQGLPQAIQEAAELYFEGEEMKVPNASSIEELEATGNYTGGQLLLIDIDTGKLESKCVRINITIPANIVSKIDKSIASSPLSRSGFLAKAATDLLKHYSR